MPENGSFRRLVTNLLRGNTPQECERLRAKIASLKAEGNPHMKTIEEFEHFASLVKEMRRLQRKWFGGDKSTATLYDSMKAERAVDKALKEMGATDEQEGRLF